MSVIVERNNKDKSFTVRSLMLRMKYDEMRWGEILVDKVVILIIQMVRLEAGERLYSRISSAPDTENNQNKEMLTRLSTD